MSDQPKPSWRDLVADKRERQRQSIPKEWILSTPQSELSQVDAFKYMEQCELLSQQDRKITNAEVDTILTKLATAEWSAVDVTTAFAKRAIVAHQLTNCLTEIFIDRALERAKELDEHLKTTGKVVGPLHGLPVSLKDQICIKGLETSMGYASWLGKYAKENAVLVDLLLNAGAVPYVRTNVPQTLMWPETFNHVFGRTFNPYNRSLTSGGSSGGEGALIALHGSPLGVGSDVGGSVRIPAAFCGLYGLRPSSGRIPYAKAVNSLEGQESVASVFGPLSNSLFGVKTFVKGVLDQKPWLADPLVVKRPWSEEEYQLVEHGHGKQLCFGLVWDDADVRPSQPVLAALELTKQALIKAGHKVIDWEPRKHKEINSVLMDIWAAGWDEDYANTTAPTGEPVIASMGLEAENVDGPVDGTGADTWATFRPAQPVSAYELWQLHLKRRELRQEYLEYRMSSKEWTGTGRPVDALITPVAPYPAIPHGENKSANYTMIFNCLDYTAIAIPVTKVDPEGHVKKPRETFYGERDKANYESYTPERHLNAPLSIQVVGMTQEEEAVIAMAEIVDEALKSAGIGKPTI